MITGITNNPNITHSTNMGGFLRGCEDRLQRALRALELPPEGVPRSYHVLCIMYYIMLYHIILYRRSYYAYYIGDLLCIICTEIILSIYREREYIILC